ncbi:MAG: DUF4239 domain-containing protein [Chloroflexota bacterium]
MQTLIQALVIIVGSVALALYGVIHVRRRVPLEVQMEQNEVAGFFIAVLGVVYGVLLAFAVIVVWEDYEDARAIAEREANAVADVHRLADVLTEPSRQQIQTESLAYARVVINEEWPMLEEGRESVTALRQLEALWVAVRAYEPKGSREETIYGKLLDELQIVNDERRMRLLASRHGIPRLVWGVLIGGGIMTVLFTYFFGLKSLRAQMAMTALYVASIGFVLFLIVAVDHPFAGTVRIEPDAMQLVMERVNLTQQAPRR